MQEGPRRLSWGRTNSKRSSQGGTSRPSSSAGQPLPQQQQYIQGAHSEATTSVCPGHQHILQRQLAESFLDVLQPAIDSWQQLPAQAVLQLAGDQGAVASDAAGQPTAALGHQPSSHVTPEQEQQIRRSVLRAVLAAILQQDGPQLDHYQLTVQAVAAIAIHKITEAANRAREEARLASAAEHKQQLAAVQSEAERTASKLLEEANCKAAAAAALHSQEVSSLQSQLSALQRDKRQLYGRTAQHSRDSKQAAAAAEESQLVLEQTRQQLQKANKQIEAKEAALVRSRQVHQQEVAALQASLGQATADAASKAQRHDLALRQLQRQHSQQLAELESNTQHKLQAASEAHKQELRTQEQQQCKMMKAMMQELHLQLGRLQDQQQEALQSLSEQCSAADTPSLHGQLQSLKLDSADMQVLVQQAVAVGSEQQAALHALQQQIAAVAPKGLGALQQQLECSRLEQQAALQQLQEASLQLATLQPVQARLQQEKQALQEQLTAAQAGARSQQQQFQDLQAQLAQCEQHVLELQVQLEGSKGKLSAAEATIQQLQDSHASAAQDAIEQRNVQLQEVQALQQHSVAASQQHDKSLRQLQQHLQWLCSSYLATPAVSAQPQQASDPGTSTLTAAVLDAAASGTASAAAAAQLKSILDGEPALLEARYQQFVQHKEQLLRGHAAEAGMLTEVQQQTLQLEAGLLQLMLRLQDVLQALEQQQQQAQLPGGFNSHSSPTRPATASSRLSDVSFAVSSSPSRAGHGDLTRQLLQALAKEKKQLTQQVKKLQSQQSVQRSYQANSLNGSMSWGLTSNPGWPRPKADLWVLPADSSNVADANAADDVDEVLVLLQDCQLANTRVSSRASSHAGDRTESYRQQTPSPGKIQARLKHSSSFSTVPVASAAEAHRVKKSPSTSSASPPANRGIASLRSAVRRP